MNESIRVPIFLFLLGPISCKRPAADVEECGYYIDFLIKQKSMKNWRTQNSI
jgi:hypothetical protein